MYFFKCFCTARSFVYCLKTLIFECSSMYFNFEIVVAFFFFLIFKSQLPREIAVTLPVRSDIST